MDEHLEKLYLAFQTLPSPEHIKGCGCSSCVSSDELKSLKESDPKTLTADQLFGYVHDALSTVGSEADFTFYLPHIMRAWSDELYDQNDRQFTDLVHTAMMRENFFHEKLKPELRDAIIEFMRVKLLERIGAEKSLHIRGSTGTHLWPQVFASYGWVTDDVPQLWSKWWAMPTVGHAISVIQWVSCLICDPKNNPVFEPWTPSGGGGPFELWQFSDRSYSARWRPSNVQFLQAILTDNYLRQSIEKVRDVLKETANVMVVEKVRDLFETRLEDTRDRCRETISRLGKLHLNPS